jgi:hypothetical protein
VFKMPEFRLQAVASGRISMVCRLKPELQRPVTGYQDTALDLEACTSPEKVTYSASPPP